MCLCISESVVFHSCYTHKRMSTCPLPYINVYYVRRNTPVAVKQLHNALDSRRLNEFRAEAGVMMYVYLLLCWDVCVLCQLCMEGVIVVDTSFSSASVCLSHSLSLSLYLFFDSLCLVHYSISNVFFFLSLILVCSMYLFLCCYLVSVRCQQCK